jgi:hypothetical protein
VPHTLPRVSNIDVVGACEAALHSIHMLRCVCVLSCERCVNRALYNGTAAAAAA